MAQALDWTTLAALSPLLAELPRAARARTRLIRLDEGQSLFRRGDRPRSMLFVCAGDVRLLRRSVAGGEIVLQRARRGFIAEGSLDQTVYHCDAVAAEPSEVLAISRPVFVAALNEPDFRDAWIAHLSRELRRVRTHNERLSLHTAEDRIVHCIEAEGEDGRLTLTQSRKEWAAELGLTHEALYRALARMTRSGRLRIDGAVLALCPPGRR